MRKFSKLLALALAVIMVMALATTAFAEGDEESKVTITVNNALAGGEYKAYKIFDVTKATDTDGKVISYAYTITGGTDDEPNPFFETVKTFAETNGNGLTLTQIGTTGVYNVTFTDTFNTQKAANLAEALYTAYQNMEQKPQADGTAIGEKETDSDSVKAKFSVADGYYFILSPIGSTCILDTTNSEKTINEKNGLPNIKKEVDKSDGVQTEVWADTNDAAFGDTVKFKITVKAEAGAQNYVVTDTLPNGLTLNATVTNGITVTGPKDSQTGVPLEENTDYTVSVNTLSNPNNFSVTFVQTYLDSLENGAELTITYNATVSNDISKIVVAGEGNVNTAKLTYGSGQEKKDTAITYVWSFKVFKFMANQTQNEVPLANAKFELYKEYDSSTGTLNNKVCFTQSGTDAVYKYATSGNITEITTGDTGAFTFTGLDSGTYYLVETAAPTGYNQLTKPIEVKIAGTDSTNPEKGSVTYKDLADTDANEMTATNNQVKVENKAGSLLPSTGGIGTTIFYVLGGILVVGAGVLLITKKRMSNSK
ncbi:MAG: SpaH/EbpB family LPXTG-anchored major pilin [Eubacteriales bacterium]|nr:SpaH/EbpB family LPXTG-anchored major pilin [Eubacteriales bacterium]